MTTINYAEPALYRANPPRHRANWSNPTTADATTTAQPTIIIVDDDPGIREALEGLLRSVGLQVKALGSVPEFVKEGRPEGPACLVLDVRLPAVVPAAAGGRVLAGGEPVPQTGARPFLGRAARPEPQGDALGP